MGVIYLPVDTAEMRHIAQRWNQTRVNQPQRDAQGQPMQATKLAHTVIRCPGTGWAKALRRGAFGVLRNVDPNAKLYVLVHGLTVGAAHQDDRPIPLVGAARGATLTPGTHNVWQGGVHKTYTPRELAKHLEAEGLSKRVRDVRLFACHGGEGGAASYGRAFATEMRQRFPFAEVSAYLGSLVATHDFTSPLANDPTFPGRAYRTQSEHKRSDLGGLEVRAKHRRIVFDD